MVSAVNQLEKEKTGKNENPISLLTDKTRGLYRSRKSLRASSITCRAKAAVKNIHANKKLGLIFMVD